jgi:hypothetical protein
MADLELKYVIDQDGNLTSVLIPIAQWRKIKAELETAYSLHGETMEKHLLAVIHQPEPQPTVFHSHGASV